MQVGLLLCVSGSLALPQGNYGAPKCEKKKVAQPISYDCTGKSLSEELITGSTNPQYGKKLFIDLPVQYMNIASLEHAHNMLKTCCVHKLVFCFDIQNNLCTQHILSMF